MNECHEFESVPSLRSGRNSSIRVIRDFHKPRCYPELTLNSNLIANNKASGGGNSNTIYIGTTPSSFTRNSLLGDDTEFTIFYNVPHGSDMNAENNFWGTTDSFEILLRIYDFFIDPSKVTPRDYKVSIPRQSVALGKRIETPIFINDAMGLRAGAFILCYDASVLKPIKVTASPILSGCYWESNLILGNSASIPAKNGEIRIAFAGANPTEGRATSFKAGKALFYIEFETLPGTDGRQSPLILETVQLSESNSIAKENVWIEVLPSKTVLLQNYPNPFNPETWIPFKLAESADVQLQIYDVRGSLVRTLHLGRKSAGTYTSKDRTAYWDGKDELGQQVASGVYFYCLQAGKFMKTRKLVVQK